MNRLGILLGGCLMWCLWKISVFAISPEFSIFANRKNIPRQGKRITPCTHIVLRTRHALVLRKVAAFLANSCHFLPNFKQGVSWYLRHFLSVADQNSDKVKSKWLLVEHSSNTSACSPLKGKWKWRPNQSAQSSQYNSLHSRILIRNHSLFKEVCLAVGIEQLTVGLHNILGFLDVLVQFLLLKTSTDLLEILEQDLLVAVVQMWLLTTSETLTTEYSYCKVDHFCIARRV